MQKPSNIRMTRQRQVILEELRNVTSHPSADEIYESDIDLNSAAFVPHATINSLPD